MLQIEPQLICQTSPIENAPACEERTLELLRSTLLACCRPLGVGLKSPDEYVLVSISVTIGLQRPETTPIAVSSLLIILTHGHIPNLESGLSRSDIENIPCSYRKGLCERFLGG